MNREAETAELEEAISSKQSQIEVLEIEVDDLQSRLDELNSME